MAESSKLLYAELSSYNYPKLYFRLDEGLKSATVPPTVLNHQSHVFQDICGIKYLSSQ